MSSHISYKELLDIVSWGVCFMPMKGNSVNDRRLDRIEKIDNAAHKGVYVGSPGKDIFFMLPHLNDKQLSVVAHSLCRQFPKKPPKVYANIAACLRFIYGQFEKQGSLRSEKDFDRMKNNMPDWSLSRKFIGLMEDEFSKDKNYYGLSMIYEMEGHRLGDEAVLFNDSSQIDKMENVYNKCVKYAYKCKNYKHLFSIPYWAYEYFKKFGDKKRAVKYGELAIKNARKHYLKYFPKGEKYYSKRLSDAFFYIKDDCEKDFVRDYGKSVRNKFEK